MSADAGLSNRPMVNFTRADAIKHRATNWLIKNWLVQDTLAALIGPSGACKTFLALDWACRVSTGIPWFGREVHQGGVFYLAGEGQTGLRKRIAAWEAHNKQTIDGAPLYLADSLPFLCDDLNAGGVIEAIREIAEEMFFANGSEPKLVVIDTVARAMGGANENSSEDMGQFVRALDWLRNEWGCTVLVLHHTGNDPGMQDRGRGSSALRAALDSEFILKPGDASFELRGSKCKDWATPHPITMRKALIDIAVTHIELDGTTRMVPEKSLALVDDIGKQYEESKREMAINLHNRGHNQRQIAIDTGASQSTINRWIKRHEAGN